LYLGIVAFTTYLGSNFFLCVTATMDLVHKKYNFTDPHHAHYFLQNVSKYILKVWFLIFMLLDMIFVPYQHQNSIIWVYSPAIFCYTIWNMAIMHGKIKGKVFWFLIIKDLLEDSFIIVQWLHYQKVLNIHLAIIPVQLLLLCFWVDFIFLKNSKYGYNKSLYTYNGKNINVSAWRLSSQVTVFVSIILVFLGSFSPMKTPVM
jgi:hypothetical protein